MDFTSEIFPGYKLHITLYKFSDATTDQLENTKHQLLDIVKTHSENFTLINAKYIASLMHIQIGVSKAIMHKEQGTMKTQSLGNEILFNLNPTHSIAQGFEKYGIKNADQACFGVFINIPESKLKELQEQISILGLIEVEELNRHVEFQDFEWIIKMFEVKESDKKMENGILNAIYSKLALKGL